MIAARWGLPNLQAGDTTRAMELVADNLTCRRGGRVVFRDLSFRVGTGQALLLRGPNGAGKSTLLRVIAGMLPVQAGDVAVGAGSLQRDRAAVQEQIAYAGHLDAVKPALTVRQNLALWAGIFGVEHTAIEAELERFDLARIGDRPVSQCSAGQKRRLGLARLPVMQRPVWLLDEPTVSLDASASALVADMIREHCAGGGIVLAATHIDLGLADSPVLELQGESAVAERVAEDTIADAFLSGDWT